MPSSEGWIWGDGKKSCSGVHPHYAELGRLAGNLNQLTRLANEGRPVHIADALLTRLSTEVRALRLALIGATVEIKPDTPAPIPPAPNPTPP